MAKIITYIDDRTLIGIDRLVGPARFATGAAIVAAGLASLVARFV